MERKHQISIWYVLIAFLAIAALQDYLAPGQVNNLPYSDFRALLKAGKLADVAIGRTVISGTLINEDTARLVSTQTAERLGKLPKGLHPFTTVRVNDPRLVTDLEMAKVRFAGRLQNKWLPRLLSWILPALVFFAIWSFFVKRMANQQGLGGMGGVTSLGRSKARVYMVLLRYGETIGHYLRRAQ